MGDVKVLDMCAGEEHQLDLGFHVLASYLNLPMASVREAIEVGKPDHEDAEAVAKHDKFVLVISSEEDTNFIADAMERMNIVAIVTWQLDERLVKGILPRSVHVSVGQPTNPEWFVRKISEPYAHLKDRKDRVVEINACSRFANMEDQIDVAMRRIAAQVDSNKLITDGQERVDAQSA